MTYGKEENENCEEKKLKMMKLHAEKEKRYILIVQRRCILKEETYFIYKNILKTFCGKVSPPF